MKFGGLSRQSRLVLKNAIKNSTRAFFFQSFFVWGNQFHVTLVKNACCAYIEKKMVF